MKREVVMLGGAPPRPTEGPLLFSGVAHAAIAVADVDASARWYAETLGMQRLWEVEDVRDDEVPAMMGASRPGTHEAHAVALYPAGLPDGRGAPVPATSSCAPSAVTGKQRWMPCGRAA